MWYAWTALKSTQKLQLAQNAMSILAISMLQEAHVTLLLHELVASVPWVVIQDAVNYL